MQSHRTYRTYEVDPLATTQRMSAFADTMPVELLTLEALVGVDPESPVGRRLRERKPCPLRLGYMFGLAAAVAFASAASLLG